MSARLRKIILAAAATLALTVAVPASSAFAIDQVACDGRNDFVQVNIDPGGENIGTRVCYANAGYADVDLGGSYSMTSGDNQVTVYFERDGGYYWFSLDRWQEFGFGGNVRVYGLYIS